jgi:NAD+ kinase
MSVGGPVVLNSAPVFSIIPVNSANPARRPLIVSDTITIGVNGISSRVAVDAVLDGQIRKQVEGTSIDVSRSPYDAVFVKFAEERVAVLQGKLQKKTEVLDSLTQVLPPSAKLVLKVLEYHEYMTQKEIVDETKLPGRTVRHALSILMSEGLVSKRLSLRDSRQGIFRVTESARKSPTTSSG